MAIAYQRLQQQLIRQILPNLTAIMLTVFSLILLVPGLTQPIMTLKVTVEVLTFSQEWEQTHSILSAAQNLLESGNYLVSGLIVLFAVAVPLIKAMLVLIVPYIKRGHLSAVVCKLLKVISPWAMNDVFLVSILVSFLSANGMENMSAEVETGFFWFTAYCFVSLISLYSMRRCVN